mgnify:CR=1 FL=1
MKKYLDSTICWPLASFYLFYVLLVVIQLNVQLVILLIPILQAIGVNNSFII